MSNRSTMRSNKNDSVFFEELSLVWSSISESCGWGTEENPGPADIHVAYSRFGLCHRLPDGKRLPAEEKLNQLLIHHLAGGLGHP